MNTTKTLFSYTRQYSKTFLLAGGLSCLYGLFSAAPAYLLQHMVDMVLVVKKTDLLLPFILIFIGMFLGKAICMYLSTYLLQRTGYCVVNDIRRDLFSRIIYFPVRFFQKHSVGDIMSRFLNDISTLQYASSVAVRNGLRSLVEAISLLSIAMYQNYMLTSLSLVVAPIIAVAIKYTGARMKQASKITQHEMGVLSSCLQEALVGIRSIKAFNGEKREHNRFAHLLSTYFSSIMKCVHYEALGPPIVELIAITGCSFVLLVASHQVMNNAITPGQLTSLFAAMLLAYQPIKRAISVYGDINYGLGAAKRIFSLIGQDTDYTGPQKLPAIPAPQHSISFHNVSFSYQDGQEILSGTTLSITTGQRIGIIGPSGIGKSTFSDLLLRFIHQDSGTICFDNNDISQFSTASIRSHIGYVGQHPFLFNDTIYANVAYGNPHASVDDVITACHQAHAHEFITQLPDGYHTSVGENGNLLSGGQKQRITIARALVRRPALLIFDEATSALDSKAEDVIAQTVQELDRSTTIIVITHRPALLQGLDEVLTIDNHQLTPVQNPVSQPVST